MEPNIVSSPKLSAQLKFLPCANVIALPAPAGNVACTANYILFSELDCERFTLMVEVTVVPYMPTLPS